MRSLLYLVHRIPYPPNKGDKIRSFHLLQALRARYRLHVGAFIDAADDRQYVPALRELCHELYVAELDARWRRLASVPALLTHHPLTNAYYRHAEFARWVERTILERSIDRVVLFSSSMGQYISPARAARLRCVIDFCDVDSDKWRQYAQRQHWPLSQLYSREARALERTEKDLASRFAATVLVSEREADTFRRLVPGCADRVHVVRNGVDAAYFDSAIEDAHQSAPTPLAHAQAGGRDVVFTGAMDYWANVEGVSWFAREVWPLVRARYPDARFLVVGSRPARAVQDLVSCEGVIVTGAVPDVRPYLRRAHVAVAPLRIARGVQNKVLEAMAMRRHVVATPAAAQGIEPLPPADLHLASSALDFAASVNAVLETATPTASLANREFVLKHYDWARNLARFLELVAGESSDESAVAAA